MQYQTEFDAQCWDKLSYFSDCFFFQFRLIFNSISTGTYTVICSIVSSSDLDHLKSNVCSVLSVRMSVHICNIALISGNTNLSWE